MTFIKPNDFSKPSVRLFGVVVSVKSDEPIISNTKRIPINAALTRPSYVIFMKPNSKMTLPGVKNTLKNTLMNKITNILRSPLNIKPNGIFDIIITPTRIKAQIP